ncbi:hypothetical protein BJF90_35095 [Pseudonocardia sp. CNS-004]|nr:hypothetical protein BJF90_35095 [Pseudonocardia sp. CNS-004]
MWRLRAAVQLAGPVPLVGGVEALAVSFMCSFLVSAHEQPVARIVAEEPPGVYLLPKGCRPRGSC